MADSLNEINAAFTRVFVHNADGRKVLEQIEQHAGLHAAGYVADSDRTVFNAGRRELAIWIRNMSKENIEKQEQQNG